MHAYVIRRNHFHLAVETPEPNLSLGLKWLQGAWALRFHRFRGEVGQPFQGRYKALHVERGEPLAGVADYIQLNPVRAGVQERFELLGADRAAPVTARAELWEERLPSLAAGFGVAVSALPTKKSAEEKLRLAAAMKHITSVSNGWLAERWQMGATTSVSSFLHRFHESGRANTRAFKAVLSRFSI